MIWIRFNIRVKSKYNNFGIYCDKFWKDNLLILNTCGLPQLPLLVKAKNIFSPSISFRGGFRFILMSKTKSLLLSYLKKKFGVLITHPARHLAAAKCATWKHRSAWTQNDEQNNETTMKSNYILNVCFQTVETLNTKAWTHIEMR